MGSGVEAFVWTASIAALLFFGCRALYRKAVADAAAAKEREARDIQEAAERIAAPLQPVSPTLALLKPREVAYATLNGQLKELKTTGWQSGTRGGSVRVAKGVYLRSSGTRGHAIKQMVVVSTGELVVTDKRLLFAGDKKSFTFNLSDLVTINPGFYELVVSNGRATHHVSVASRVELLVFVDRVHKLRERMAA